MLLRFANTTATVFLQLKSMFVTAYPVEHVVMMTRDDGPAVVLGEHADHRTIIVVFCISYSFLLALAQGMSSSSLLTLFLGSLTQRRVPTRPHGWTEDER